MADSEDALSPSKKRSAGRELTRDIPVDDDDDTPEVEAGTFKRASDEVLASRRIVKVQQTNSAEATAGTQEADSKGSDVIIGDSEKAKDEEGKQPEGETHKVEDKSATNKDAADESNADKEHVAEKNNDQKSELNDDKSESEDKKYATDKESANDADKEKQKDDDNAEIDDKKENTDNHDKKADKVEGEEQSTEGGPFFKSFLQLSSSQNAFTGLAGTGFSTSLFSFGSKDGSATGSSGSGSIFDLKNDNPFGLGLSNNGSSGFGAPSIIPKAEGSGLALQEVPVETGEENEKVVFNADSVLFEFSDGSWKERGKGELKVNVNSGTEKARLLMRARGNYRLILNARLYPDMKLTNMEKKGVTFACINSATEGKEGLSTFALKFKDGSIVEEFRAVIMAHKGEALSNVPNTSENSPKASV